MSFKDDWRQFWQVYVTFWTIYLGVIGVIVWFVVKADRYTVIAS